MALLYTHHGFVHANAGDFARAIADWEAALKIDPYDSNTSVNIQRAPRDSILDTFLEENPDLITLQVDEWPEEKVKLLQNILHQHGIGSYCPGGSK